MFQNTEIFVIPEPTRNLRCDGAQGKSGTDTEGTPVIVVQCIVGGRVGPKLSKVCPCWRKRIHLSEDDMPEIQVGMMSNTKEIPEEVEGETWPPAWHVPFRPHGTVFT